MGMQTEFIDRYAPANDSPILVCLSFSAGSQSTAILEMVLRGELDRPDRFIVLCADPGMEDSRSLVIRKYMLERCQAQGISCKVVAGGDLFKDVIEGCRTGERIDSPPLWTVDDAGKVGQLNQQCTQAYKIRPIKREVRKELTAMGVKSLTDGCVEQWIGFAYDERRRVKPPDARYIQFRYPLIDRKLTRRDVSAMYRRWGIDEPPTSVCNACFANGLDKFRWMYENDKAGWRQAVEFDNALRGPNGVPGVKGTCYVSRTCLPLEELAALGFELPKEYRSTKVDYSCDSGFCFL